MHITAPNYTQTPNDLFDHWLPHLGEAELKVLLVILRKTFGWHRTRDRISLSQLSDITGLDRRNVMKATKKLQEKGLIKKEVIGDNGSQQTYYELIVGEVSNNCYQGRETPPPRGEKPPTKETLTKERKKDDEKERKTSSPFFDWKEGKLKDYAHLLERWRQQYPDVDLNTFIPFMESKISAQPSRYKRYKSIDKTVIEFLKREQERINASKIKKETVAEKEKENKNNKALENRKWIIEKLSNLSKHEYLMVGDKIKIEDTLIIFKYANGYMPLGYAEETFKEQVYKFLEYIGL